MAVACYLAGWFAALWLQRPVQGPHPLRGQWVVVPVWVALWLAGPDPFGLRVAVEPALPLGALVFALAVAYGFYRGCALRFTGCASELAK